MPPVDPTQDADFMAAAPHEQMAYLNHIDPEFAKASPQDQMGYLMHIRGLGSTISGPAKPSTQMQYSNQTALQETGMTTDPKMGAMMNPQSLSPAAASTAGGIAAGGAALLGAMTPAGAAVGRGALAVGKAAVQAAPYVAAGEGINYLRQNVPMGKYIPPGTEMLPMFMAGMRGGKEPTPSAAPTEPEAIAAQRYQSVPLEGPTTPSVTGKNPYAGPRIPPMEPVQSTTINKSGYHGDSQTMVVQFKNGNVYELRGVPKAVYDKYQQSESQGSFYSTNLKGRYETNKLGVVKPGAK